MIRYGQDMTLKLRSISLTLPFGLGGVTIDVSEAERRAAWELYVEFATRIASYSLEPGTGLVSEALTSLHSLFATTREVLRAAGPDIGQGPDSVGAIAIRVLNEGVRPFLSDWHQELRHGLDEEPSAERRATFESELLALREGLETYVDALAALAGVAGTREEAHSP